MPSERRINSLRRELKKQQALVQKLKTEIDLYKGIMLRLELVAPDEVATAREGYQSYLRAVEARERMGEEIRERIDSQMVKAFQKAAEVDQNGSKA